MADTTQGSIIDAHVHVWSPDTHKYPFAPGFDDLPSFTPEDHFQYSRQLGVGRMNLVQMTWYGLDHSYILDLIAGDPETFVGTGIVPALSDVRLPSPDRTMVALSRGGIYAFRVRGAKNARMMPLGDWPKWLDHAEFEKMFAAGAEHNLALSFQLSPDDIPEVDRMCARFPETPVIIDHIGGIKKTDGVFPDEQVGMLCRLARYRRVMVKLGPFHAKGEREQRFLDLLPLVRRVVDAFGPERCMWESDSSRPVAAVTDPPADIEAGISLIRDHADFLSGPDKDQILFKTAEDFFFLR